MLPVVPPSFAARCGAASVVRLRSAKHNYAVTGVPGAGSAICQNKERKTKNNIFPNDLCSLLFFVFGAGIPSNSGVDLRVPSYRLAATGGSLQAGDGVCSVIVVWPIITCDESRRNPLFD